MKRIKKEPTDEEKDNRKYKQKKLLEDFWNKGYNSGINNLFGPTQYLF